MTAVKTSVRMNAMPAAAPADRLESEEEGK